LQSIERVGRHIGVVYIAVNLANATVTLSLADSDANVAILTPTSVPRVPDNRVLLSLLFTEANCNHTVVDGRSALESRIDDAALVRVEGARHSEGSRHWVLSQSRHERVVIVVRQIDVRVIRISEDHRLTLFLDAGLLSSRVRVVSLRPGSVSSPERVRVCGPATVTATIPYDVTIDKLLLREVVQLAHLDGSNGFDRANSHVGPA